MSNELGKLLVVGGIERKAHYYIVELRYVRDMEIEQESKRGL